MRRTLSDLERSLTRLREIRDASAVVGEALLVDFPLRLWARQQEHMDGLRREFEHLVGAGDAPESAPQRLLDVAEMFTVIFGALIDPVYEERRAALAAGLDRIDSRVPLVSRTPDLIDHLRVVLDAADEYCRSGHLLTLARPPEVVALSNWTFSELVAQFYGSRPTPWAGPF